MGSLAVDVDKDNLVWIDGDRGVCSWPLASESFDYDEVMEESCIPFFDPRDSEAQDFVVIP